MATENPILPAPEEQVSKAAEDVQKATSEVTPEVLIPKRLRLQNPKRRCRAGRTRSVRRRGAQAKRWPKRPSPKRLRKLLLPARLPQMRLQTGGSACGDACG
ncbi:MAG: hypothetical protein ACLRMJ_07645 [Alistipes finegoldii]